MAEGFGPDVKLTRTQTIMQGGSHCDFRYRRQAERSAPGRTLLRKNEEGFQVRAAPAPSFHPSRDCRDQRRRYWSCEYIPTRPPRRWYQARWIHGCGKDLTRDRARVLPEDYRCHLSYDGEDRGDASASPPEVSNPAIHVSSKLSLYQTRRNPVAQRLPHILMPARSQVRNKDGDGWSSSRLCRASARA